MSNLDHAYDEYLATNEKSAIKAIGNFAKELHNEQIRFGRTILPTYFKPHFLKEKQERLIKNATESMIKIMDKVIDIYINEPNLRGQFEIDPEVEEWLLMDPGYKQSVVFSRIDGFIEGESLKLVEFNTDSPAGAAYADRLGDLITAQTEMNPFFESHHLKWENRIQKNLDALLRCYEEFGGSERPQIAIVDWRTVRTHPEFQMIKSLFEAKGYKTIIADPRDLQYRGGKLYHNDFRIDLIYRRVIFNELMAKRDEVEDFLKAYKERAVCVVNPFRSKIAGTKAVLSILTNPVYERFFTEKENELKRELIPWTRQLMDAERFYGEKKIFLIDFLKDEKDFLILKPGDSYDAKDVFVGRETPEEDWNRALDRALKENWVFQEFANVPIMSVPEAINNKLDFVYKKVSIGLYTAGGKYSGAMSRLCDDMIISVAHGAGLIPCVVFEEER
jgi:glutathionylspermidine synthase